MTRGESVESAAHIYLNCKLYRDFRNPLSLFADKWIRAVAALPPWEAPVTPIRTLADVMHWVHHATPLVHSALLGNMNLQMRQKALAFHSQVLHERYVTGRSSLAPHDDPEYLVPLAQPHLLNDTTTASVAALDTH